MRLEKLRIPNFHCISIIPGQNEEQRLEHIQELRRTTEGGLRHGPKLENNDGYAMRKRLQQIEKTGFQ